MKLRDATCLLVHHAHKQVRQLVEDGYHPVVIGRRGHVEVRGLTEDLSEHDVVLSEDDIDALSLRRRYGVVAQTTQPIARVHELVDYLKNRFPAAEVRFEDTVCQPTKQRQSAAVELAKRSDVVLVVGGATATTPTNLPRPAGSIVAKFIMYRGRAMFGRSGWRRRAHLVSRQARPRRIHSSTRLNPECMN